MLVADHREQLGAEPRPLRLGHRFGEVLRRPVDKASPRARRASWVSSCSITLRMVSLVSTTPEARPSRKRPMARSMQGRELAVAA